MTPLGMLIMVAAILLVANIKYFCLFLIVVFLNLADKADEILGLKASSVTTYTLYFFIALVAGFAIFLLAELFA